MKGRRPRIRIRSRPCRCPASREWPDLKKSKTYKRVKPTSFRRLHQFAKHICARESHININKQTVIVLHINHQCPSATHTSYHKRSTYLVNYLKHLTSQSTYELSHSLSICYVDTNQESFHIHKLTLNVQQRGGRGRGIGSRLHACRTGHRPVCAVRLHDGRVVFVAAAGRSAGAEQAQWWHRLPVSVVQGKGAATRREWLK